MSHFSNKTPTFDQFSAPEQQAIYECWRDLCANSVYGPHHLAHAMEALAKIILAATVSNRMQIEILRTALQRQLTDGTAHPFDISEALRLANECQHPEAWAQFARSPQVVWMDVQPKKQELSQPTSHDVLLAYELGRSQIKRIVDDERDDPYTDLGYTKR